MNYHCSMNSDNALRSQIKLRFTLIFHVLFFFEGEMTSHSLPGYVQDGLPAFSPQYAATDRKVHNCLSYDY